MSEAEERTPRLAVWGFGFSLVGCVLAFASFFGFTVMMAASSGRAWAAPWGLLSIPGLVLSVRSLRAARRRDAPRGWAEAGVVLGIVGTVVLVLYIAWWVVFVWAIRSLE